jgi:hypothetical protein
LPVMEMLVINWSVLPCQVNVEFGPSLAPAENHDVAGFPSTAADAGYWLEYVELAETVPSEVMLTGCAAVVGGMVAGTVVVVEVADGFGPGLVAAKVTTVQLVPPASRSTRRTERWGPLTNDPVSGDVPGFPVAMPPAWEMSKYPAERSYGPDSASPGRARVTVLPFRVTGKVSPASDWLAVHPLEPVMEFSVYVPATVLGLGGASTAVEPEVADGAKGLPARAPTGASVSSGPFVPEGRTNGIPFCASMTTSFDTGGPGATTASFVGLKPGHEGPP